MTRDPKNPARIYPEQRKYEQHRAARTIDASLPAEDRPARFPVTVENYIPPEEPADEGFHDPARFNEDHFVRWCNCCNTVLKPNGQSPFCTQCRKDYDALRKRRKRWETRGVVDVDRRHP